MIRVGFIGAGGIAREYLQRLECIPDVEVSAFSDLDLGRAEALARPRCARAYTDYIEMLERERLEAVFDCLPPFARGDEISLAAERGCDIFTTKPLGLELELARRTQERVEAEGVITSVGYMFRYSGITDYAQQLVQGRQIALFGGEVLGAIPGSWWWGKKERSGGQIVEQSTHIVDVMRYFGGDVEQVYALGSSGHVPERVDFEDASTVALRFRHGATGSLTSICTVLQFFFGLMLVGRDMLLKLDYMDYRVSGTIDGQAIDYQDQARSGYQEQVSTFIDAVRSRDRSAIRSSYADGVKTLAVTLAANRSLQSGMPELVE